MLEFPLERLCHDEQYLFVQFALPSNVSPPDDIISSDVLSDHNLGFFLFLLLYFLEYLLMFQSLHSSKIFPHSLPHSSTLTLHLQYSEGHAAKFKGQKMIQSVRIDEVQVEKLG